MPTPESEKTVPESTSMASASLAEKDLLAGWVISGFSGVIVCAVLMVIVVNCVNCVKCAQKMRFLVIAANNNIKKQDAKCLLLQ